jgi:hypothetical protein
MVVLVILIYHMIIRLCGADPSVVAYLPVVDDANIMAQHESGMEARNPEVGDDRETAAVGPVPQAV